jgi:hypothetical protein
MKYILDVDASKVIEAVRSTGVTITPAMMHYAHYLISNMKNIGTWQLSNAVYGFVGGTAASHKFNWKDLRDVDAAFRLTFSGTITHNANGMQGNGTTGYANTNLNPSLIISLNNQGYDFYIKDNIQGIANSPFGADDTTGGIIRPIINTNTTTALAIRISSNVPSLSVLTNDKTGFYSFQRISSSNVELYFKNIKSSNSAVSTALVNQNIFIGAYNANGTPLNFSTSTIKFSTIRQSITELQSFQQSQIVTNAQAILNRL